jgi:FixJ family two-component response regulator
MCPLHATECREYNVFRSGGMDMSSTNAICIVDDDISLLRAMTRTLSMEGFHVESFAAPDAFLEYAQREHPACIVLDMRLTAVTGLQIQAELIRRDIECPIVFLSGESNIAMSVEAMRAGAFDFLTKPVDSRHFVKVVSEATQYHTDRMHAVEELVDRWNSLTPREKEVCRRVVEGQLNKEIAASLGTAEKTIKVHRGRAMRKMHARRVTDLVRMTQLLTASRTLV